MADDNPDTTQTQTQTKEVVDAPQKPTEPKTEGGKDDPQKPVESPKQEPRDQRPEPKVPVTYDLKLPEGSLLDERHMEKIVAFSKQQGFSNEDAQAILDVQSEQAAKSIAEQSEAWLSQVKSDKEIGGEAFGKSAELAKRVVDRFGTSELKEGLDRYGFGNHPELIRMLSRIGTVMNEDQFIAGPSTTSSGRPKTAAEIMYPKHAQTENP